MTPYELRYKIYEDARTLLENEYQHLCEEYKRGELEGKPPAFPTHSPRFWASVHEPIVNDATVRAYHPNSPVAEFPTWRGLHDCRLYPVDACARHWLRIHQAAQRLTP